MARKKVKLAFIINDAARRASYNKRKKSLMKKTEELTTLCGVEACAIVYSRYDPQPEIWPSPVGVQNVVSKFLTMPELEQSKKMVNQTAFLEQRIVKTEKQLDRQIKENKENQMTMYMFQCLAEGKIVDDNMSLGDLNELCRLIDQSLKDVDRRMETLNLNDAEVMAPTQAPMIAPTQAMTMNEDVALVNPTNGLGMNADTIQNLGFVDLMKNGNEDEDYFPNL